MTDRQTILQAVDAELTDAALDAVAAGGFIDAFLEIRAAMHRRSAEMVASRAISSRD